MNKRAAIKLIEGKIVEANKLPDGYRGDWMRITSSIVCMILEPGSEEHYRVQELANLHFSIHDHSRSTATAGMHARSDIINRLTHALEQIKVHGPYVRPKTNFLSSMSDSAFWTIISITVPAIFFGGHELGRHSSDLEKMELRQENRELKDKIPPPSMSSTNENANQEGGERRENDAEHDSTKHLIGK